MISGWDRLHAGYDEGPSCRKSDSFDVCTDLGVLGNGGTSATDANAVAAKDAANECGETPPPKMTTSATSATCAASAVGRGFSTSSDSKLLEDEIGEEVRVIMRPRRPPRPKSEVFLDRAQKRKSKRYSAFGVSAMAIYFFI